MSARTPQTVPLAQLRSPYQHIEFRKSEDPPGSAFIGLMRAFTRGEAVEPIEVVQHQEAFVILNGVRRAKAAQLAGRTDIQALVFQANVVGAPAGQTWPLTEVTLPFTRAV
jgi:hypothetical protein